ncbi:MAG: hypothetical protein RLZZ480_98 [Candidatus Parcubacteria bacterium]
MFANPTNVGISQRVVATLVACAVVLMSIGIYNIAQAANLTGVKDTLTESAPSTASNHTIEFTVPTGSPGVAASGGTIVVTFPTGFNMNSIDFADVDLKVATVDQTLAAAPAASTWGVVLSGQTLTFTTGSGVSVTAGQAVEIQVGTHATFGTTGNTQVTNHASTGSYEFIITAGTTDSGRTRVAIVNSVNVTAIVDTTFDFTITGTATSTFVDTATTTGSTSPTVIAFSKLVANVPEILAQRLNVTTNAKNGFNVTVETDGNIDSSTGADIDSFSNATDISTPTVWSSPTNSISDENTWGHWGVTTMDNVTLFDPGEYIAASTTPRSIFSHTGPANGTTNDIGSTTVAYKVQITPLQEAAQDYNAVLTYIATPTF